MSDFNNLKVELNYSLFSTDGDLVSTDANRMLIIEGVQPAPKNNMLLKCSSISPKIDSTCNLMKLNTPARHENEVGKYPEYMRIIPKYLKDTINLQDNIDIDNLLKILYNKVLFNYKYILDLYKIKDICIKNVEFNETPRDPFVISGTIDGYKFKYIIMPIY